MSSHHVVEHTWQRVNSVNNVHLCKLYKFSLFAHVYMLKLKHCLCSLASTSQLAVA